MIDLTKAQELTKPIKCWFSPHQNQKYIQGYLLKICKRKNLNCTPSDVFYSVIAHSHSKKLTIISAIYSDRFCADYCSLTDPNITN